MGHIHLFTVVGAVLLCVYVANVDANGLSKLFSIFKKTHLYLPTPEDGCGISKVANQKIVGGEPAKNGAYPWMALLGYPKGFDFSSFDCGGTLITSRHVLTAAHCLDPEVGFVRLGEYDLTTTDDGEHQDIKVVKQEKHPKFDPDEVIYDIAVLTLERDVEFNDRIRPICLPVTKELKINTFNNTNPFVAGWGQLREKGRSSSVLMHVQLPVIDNDECEWVYIQRFGKDLFSDQFSDISICAGLMEGGHDSCKGDSGGPLMLPIQVNSTFPMYQIGVVSWGLKCGQRYAPGIYSRVSHFVDWINDKVKPQK